MSAGVHTRETRRSNPRKWPSPDERCRPRSIRSRFVGPRAFCFFPVKRGSIFRDCFCSCPTASRGGGDDGGKQERSVTAVSGHCGGPRAVYRRSSGRFRAKLGRRDTARLHAFGHAKTTKQYRSRFITRVLGGVVHDTRSEFDKRPRNDVTHALIRKFNRRVTFRRAEWFPAGFYYNALKRKFQSPTFV